MLVPLFAGLFFENFMETKKYCIQKEPTLTGGSDRPSASEKNFLTGSPVQHMGQTLKNQLMISRGHINRLIIFTFILLVGAALIYGIRTRSITGIILSLTSLGAGIHFLTLLAKARKEMEQEQEETA